MHDTKTIPGLSSALVRELVSHFFAAYRTYHTWNTCHKCPITLSAKSFRRCSSMSPCSAKMVASIFWIICLWAVSVCSNCWIWRMFWCFKNHRSIHARYDIVSDSIIFMKTHWYHIYIYIYINSYSITIIIIYDLMRSAWQLNCDYHCDRLAIGNSVQVGFWFGVANFGVASWVPRLVQSSFESSRYVHLQFGKFGVATGCKIGVVAGVKGCVTSLVWEGKVWHVRSKCFCHAHWKYCNSLLEDVPRTENTTPTTSLKKQHDETRWW